MSIYNEDSQGNMMEYVIYIWINLFTTSRRDFTIEIMVWIHAAIPNSSCFRSGNEHYLSRYNVGKRFTMAFRSQEP